MGIARAVKNFNSFINGTVTDANEFNAPENAVRDCENVVIDSDGVAKRRLGFQPTDAGSDNFSYTGTANLVETQTVLWPNAGDNRDRNIAVVQFGHRINFYDADEANFNTALLDTHNTGFTPGAGELFDMFPGEDGAFYLCSSTGMLRFTWDSGTDTESHTSVFIKVRDTDGVNDGLDVDEHENILSANHHYNLLNQGWDDTKINTYIGNPSTWAATTGYALNALVLPTTPNGYRYKNLNAGTSAGTEPTWPTTIGGTVVDGTCTWQCEVATSYPSNSQQWFEGRDASNNFSPTELLKLDFGKAPAPRGRFIFEARNIARSSIVTGATDLVVGGYYGAKHGAYYAGRMWFTAMKDYDGVLFYSKLLTAASATNPHGDPAYEACYSDNDVTSEFFNEILDTDGGVLSVPEMGTPLKLAVISNSLLIFTSRGIWSVSGGYGASFKPSDFSVKKLSADILTSRASVVIAESSIYYWTTSGINVVSVSQADTLAFSSITDQRYRNGYLAAAETETTALSHARGFYDSHNNYIEWSYPSFASYYQHDMVLRYNISTGAITRYRIPTLQAGFGNYGIGGLIKNFANPQLVHYLCIWYTGTLVYSQWHVFTATDFNDTDPSSSTSADNGSYLLAWPVHVGAPDRDKQAQYLTTYVKRTETQWLSSVSFDKPSGLTATVWWDWYGTSGSTKKTGPHNVYRMLRLESPPASFPTSLVYNKDIVVNKTKIRGKGHAYTIKFDSVADKDFQFLGWTTPLLVETEE